MLGARTEATAKQAALVKIGERDLESICGSLRMSAAGANVVVNMDQGKFASAHDLRRAFGTRWSAMLKPVELQHIMRPASIETTLKYYVRQDADTLAASVWNAVVSNSSDKGKEPQAAENLESESNAW